MQVTLPNQMRSPGAWFMLGGALKLLLVCFPFSAYALMIFLQGADVVEPFPGPLPVCFQRLQFTLSQHAGNAELGILAMLKMVPLAAALAFGAKYITDTGLHQT